jgi:hypothetical protein
MDYIDYLLNREDFDCALDGMPILRSGHATWTYATWI